MGQAVEFLKAGNVAGWWRKQKDEMSDKASDSEPGEKVEQHSANVSSIICGKERTGRICFWNTSRCIFLLGCWAAILQSSDASGSISVRWLLTRHVRRLLLRSQHLKTLFFCSTLSGKKLVIQVLALAFSYPGCITGKQHPTMHFCDPVVPFQ